MRVAISTITRGTPRVEYVGSLFGIYKSPHLSYIDLRPTLYLHHGRSEATLDFLDNDRGDWLFFIDDDTEFTPNAFNTVLDACDPETAPICGGIYWSPNMGTSDPTSDVFPVIFQHQAGQRDSQYRDTFVDKPYPRGWTAAQVDPFPVDAIGTGFLCVHKSVFLRLKGHFPPPLHWFDMETVDGVACGEDLVFCHRARELGYPIHAVPLSASDIAHIKTVKIRMPDV